MKKVTILLTKYSDWISSLLYYIGGYGFTHASIGLEEQKTEFFSFNYKGFCIETTEKHHRRGVRKSLMYEVEVTDSVYNEIKGRLSVFQANRTDFHYTRFGLFCAIIHIPFRWKNHYICSQFVAELLKDTGAVTFKKQAELYLPNQLCKELDTYAGLVDKIQNPI